MFERKPELKISKIREDLEKESQNPTEPIIFGVVAGALTGVLTFALGTRNTRPFEMELTRIIVISAVTLIATIALTYICQRVRGKSITNEIDIKVCPKCLVSKNRLSSKCSCGASLEPREFYTYVEKK